MRVRKDAGAMILLFVATLAFFAPAVLGSRAVFTWNMDLWYPWRASASEADLARAARLTDCPRQFFIMREIATNALREGRVPLWNRWIYAGTPFLANYQPAVFYPPNLLLAWSGLSVVDQMTASTLFHFFAAASGAYVLLRLFRIGPLAALLGAVVLAFCPIQVARTGITTMPATGCWLPWVLASTRLFFQRGGAGSWAAMAGTLAMSALGGHFQILVFVGYAWILFGILEGIGRLPKTPRGRWASWGAAGMLALVVSGVHLLPTLEFVPRSQEAENSRAELISGTLHPWALAKMVVPDVLGHPADRNNATHHLRVGSGFYFQTEHSTVVYVGILPLLLAGVALLNPGDHRRATLFAFLLAAGGLLVSLPTPVLELGRFLPGMDFSRPDRATTVYGWGMAFLAAIGAHRLASNESAGGLCAGGGLALATGVLACGFAVLVAVAGPRLLPREITAALGESYVARAGWIAAFAAAVSFAVVALRAGGRLGSRGFAAAALLVACADLGWSAERLNVMQPKASIYRAALPGGAIEFLTSARESDGPFRIMRFETERGPYAGVFPPSCPAHYGIEDVLGFDSLNSVLYQELIDAVDPEIISNRGNFRGTNRPGALASPILDLLGARYVLAIGDPDLPDHLLVHRSDLSVYENPGALPRAFLVGEIRTAPNGAEIVRAMADPSFRPDRWAYAEEPIDGFGADAASPDSAGVPGTCRVETPFDEEVRVRVETPRRAVLVLTDSWYPGWIVSVDGVPRPLYRVDHAFRGVVIEPGTHDVVFRYRPASFRWGLALSLAGVAGIGLGSIALRRAR